MAVRNNSLVPFKVTSIPDRYTPVYIADDTQVTQTTGTGAVVRLNRLQGGSFAMATQVTDVVEMGATYRPGGIDDLGEVKWSLSWNAVGIGNIAALTGVKVDATPGVTTTIDSTDVNAATVDFIRLVADVQGTVFGTLYMPDCIIDDYSVDAKEKGVVTEMASGRGPAAVFFPGFIIPKVYNVSTQDVTNGYIGVVTPATGSSILGADEAIVEIFSPAAGEPPSYFQQNGSQHFLKIEKIPHGDITKQPIRYYEQFNSTTQSAVTAGIKWITPDKFGVNYCQVGQKIDIGRATGVNTEYDLPILAVASQVNTQSGTSAVGAPGSVTITPTSMQGIEVGVALQIDANGAHGTYEVVQVTAVTSTTFDATYANVHTAHFTIATNAPSIQVHFFNSHTAGAHIHGALGSTVINNEGFATYFTSTDKLFLSDTFSAVNSDFIRLTLMSYNTDSYPLTIPTNPDTADVPGVSTRLIPLNLNGLKADRVQSASFKMSLKRNHVQGIGENQIIYGVSSVPDVAIDMNVTETDLTLLSQLSTGSKNLTSYGGTIQNDFQDLNYITRNNLANAVPASINLLDPFDASKILCTWQSPQVVVTDINYSSSNKADNSVKLTAMDITGNFTVSFTEPL